VLTAETEPGRAIAVGQESEVANLDEPDGNTWSKKRRMNSVAGKVIVLMWL